MRYCCDKERMNHDGTLLCEIQAVNVNYIF